MRPLVRVLAALSIVALWAACDARAQEVSVASSTGQVELLRPPSDRWAPLAGVGELQAEDLIRSGSTGSARLLFDDGSAAVLASGTLLRLEEVGGKEGRRRVLLRLLSGQVRATVSTKYPAEGRFEIETPTAVVVVRGTEFIVTYHVDNAETEVACVRGGVEVLGVLGVLGRPVILEEGMGTTVRKGAFPAPPSPVSPEKLAAMAEAEGGAISFEDGLMATYTGADSAAVLRPPNLGASGSGRRESRRTRRSVISKDAEVIDQSIQEYTLTPPGQTPPGSVTVIINP